MLDDEVFKPSRRAISRCASEAFGFNTSKAFTDGLIFRFKTHGIHLAHDVFLPSTQGHDVVNVEAVWRLTVSLRLQKRFHLRP